MNDLYVRSGINTLTGLTTLSQEVGVPTDLTLNTWVSIYAIPNTPEHIILKAYKVSLGADVDSAEFRIVAAPSDAPGTATDGTGSKTFPFGDSTAVLSNVDMVLDFPLQVPKNHELFLQVKAQGAGVDFSAMLEYLSVINIPTLNAI